MSTVKKQCKCKNPKSKGLFTNHLKELKAEYYNIGYNDGLSLGIVAGALGIGLIYFIIKFIYG
jgi:hypothetical protein